MFSKSIKDVIKNPIVIIPNILLALMSLLSYPLAGGYIDNADYSTLAPKLATLGLFMALFLVYLILVLPLFTCWSYLMCRDAVNEKKPSFTESFKSSWKRYPLALGTMALLALMLIGAMFAIGLLSIPIILLMNFSDAGSISAGAIIASVIVAFIVLCAILFLTVIISPILIVQIYDQLDLGKSFSYGFKLGFKKFFPILGVMLLAMIITLPVYLLLGWLSGSLETLHPVYNFIYTSIAAFPGMVVTAYIMNQYKNVYETQNKPSLNPDAELPLNSPVENSEVEEITVPTNSTESGEEPNNDHIV